MQTEILVRETYTAFRSALVEANGGAKIVRASEIVAGLWLLCR
jgi:hypothetical protein